MTQEVTGDADAITSDDTAVIADPSRLASARESAGYSVQDVATRLRMSARQIEAIEAGDWASLPGLAFVRGAVRSYGRLLDRDVAPLLEAIGGYVPPATAAMPRRRKASVGGAEGFGSGGSGSRWLWGILGVVGVVVIAMFFGRGAEPQGDSARAPNSSGRVRLEPATTGSGAAAGGTRTEAATASDSGSGTGPEPSRARSGAAASDAASTPPAGGAVATAVPSPALDSASTGSADAATSSATTSTAVPGTGAPAIAGPGSKGTSVASATTADAPAGASPAATASDAKNADTAASTDAATSPAPARPAPSGSERSPASAVADANKPGVKLEMPLPTGDSSGSDAALRLVFSGDSWVEVRDAAGKILFTGTRGKGVALPLSGSAPFALIIGKASNVRVERQGRNIDLEPSMKQGVARLKVK